jgi:hypothetical protein
LFSFITASDSLSQNWNVRKHLTNIYFPSYIFDCTMKFSSSPSGFILLVVASSTAPSCLAQDPLLPNQFPSCYVCSDGSAVTNPDMVLDVPVSFQSLAGETVTCGKVQQAAYSGLIPEWLCTLIQVSPMFQEPCGCAGIGVDEEETLPTTTSSPTAAATNATNVSDAPSSSTSSMPSDAPSMAPSTVPSSSPSDAPSLSPSDAPSLAPVVAEEDDVLPNDATPPGKVEEDAEEEDPCSAVPVPVICRIRTQLHDQLCTVLGGILCPDRSNEVESQIRCGPSGLRCLDNSGQN